MQRNIRWMIVAPLIAGALLAACQNKATKTAKTKPAKVERVEGSEVSKVILTPKAAERLDIQTDEVREVPVRRSGMQEAAATSSRTVRKVVSYAAVLYDAQGRTWVYTSPEPLAYIRARITIDYIDDDDQAVLVDGPPAGTKVVVVGGAELFGAEFEIGK